MLYFSDTIRFGSVEWMRFNFNKDVFLDGSPVPELKSPKEVDEAILNKLPGFVYPYFNRQLGETLGKLYTREAVFGKKQLIPSGWKVPALSDFNEMSNRICLKSLKRNAVLLNSDSGFSELDGPLLMELFQPQPAGFLMGFGFQCVGRAAYLWASPEKQSDAAIWSAGTNGERKYVTMPGVVAGLFSLRLIRSI